jgi:general secretion pathway protein A
MYADFYGLKRRPFRTDPRGSAVFVGPQTARLMKCMNSALVGSDAVVAISGAAGLGKSTLAARALDAHADRVSVIHMPRAQLAHDEVLGFLLEQLGAETLPRSTIRQVLLCRRLIAEAEEGGKSICVLVEDATRIGDDALIELEALTASDGNEDHGGRIVLLGSGELPAQLKSPQLARLRQRTRLRFVVEPLTAGELQGYLKHCFRLAGREFDELFEDGAAAALFSLTGGVPRLTNNLVESILAAGAEDGIERIGVGLIGRISREEYDLELDEVPATNATPGTAPAKPVGSEQHSAHGSALDDDRSGQQPAEENDVPALNSPLPDLAELADEVANNPMAPTGETDEIPTLFESSRMTSPAVAASRNEPEESESSPAPEAAEAEARATVLAEPSPETGEIRAVPAPPQLTLEDAAAEPAAPTTEEAPKAVAQAEHGSPELDAAPWEVPDNEPDAGLLEEPALESCAEQPQATIEASTQAPASGDDDAEAPETPAREHDPTLAELRPDLEAQAPASGDDDVKAPETPAWERDPTLAELRPDLEALELAMADFGTDEEPGTPARHAHEKTGRSLRDQTIIGLPEITLDAAIQEKIKEAQQALEEHDQTIAEEDIEDAPGAGNDAASPARDASAAAGGNAVDAQFREVADGIARARSIEDVDDKMAETLFGEEFSAIAAQVAANAPGIGADSEADPPGEPAPAELELVDESAASATSANGANGSGESDFEKEFKELYGEDSLEVSLHSEARGGGMDLSASQRLATVRALNAERNSSPGRFPRPTASGGAGRPSGAPAAPPQPIEEQITTSLTQTLKTLKVRPPSANDAAEDDDDDQPKGGFFSRFRRN